MLFQYVWNNMQTAAMSYEVLPPRPPSLAFPHSLIPAWVPPATPVSTFTPALPSARKALHSNLCVAGFLLTFRPLLKPRLPDPWLQRPHPQLPATGTLIYCWSVASLSLLEL